MKPLAKLQSGDVVDGVFIVSECNIRTATNPRAWPGAAKWRGLSLVIRDATGTMSAFLSGCEGNADLMTFAHTWETVRIVGVVKDGQTGLEIKASEIRYEAGDIDALTPKALRSAVEYEARLDELIGLLDAPLANVVYAVFTEDVRARFFRIPASEKKHHACLGGLGQHTIEVAEIAGDLAHTLNRVDHPVSWAICVAGALLHDAGKVIEYSGDSFPATVGEGGLTGHVYEGAKMVARAAGGLVNADLLRQIEAVLLSHHGKQEWGAPVTPSTPEAMIVHMADMLSTWAQGYREANAAPGAMWARSPICGFVWKGERYGILSDESDEPEAPSLQPSLFDDPKPAPFQPSPFRPAAMVPPTTTSADDLDDPFL